jgi:hypothetical protein
LYILLSELKSETLNQGGAEERQSENMNGELPPTQSTTNGTSNQPVPAERSATIQAKATHAPAMEILADEPDSAVLTPSKKAKLSPTEGTTALVTPKSHAEKSVTPADQSEGDHPNEPEQNSVQPSDDDDNDDDGVDPSYRNTTAPTTTQSPRRSSRERRSTDRLTFVTSTEQDVPPSAQGFTCPYCLKSFTSRLGCIYHIDNKVCQESNKSFVCPQCQQRFSNRYGYNYHLSQQVCMKRLKKTGEEESRVDLEKGGIDSDGEGKLGLKGLVDDLRIVCTLSTNLTCVDAADAEEGEMNGADLEKENNSDCYGLKRQDKLDGIDNIGGHDDVDKAIELTGGLKPDCATLHSCPLCKEQFDSESQQEIHTRNKVCQKADTDKKRAARGKRAMVASRRRGTGTDSEANHSGDDGDESVYSQTDESEYSAQSGLPPRERITSSANSNTKDGTKRRSVAVDKKQPGRKKARKVQEKATGRGRKGKKGKKQSSEELSCPHCSKCFTSQLGLDYHVNMAVCQKERTRKKRSASRNKTTDQGERKRGKVASVASTRSSISGTTNLDDADVGARDGRAGDIGGNDTDRTDIDYNDDGNTSSVAAVSDNLAGEISIGRPRSANRRANVLSTVNNPSVPAQSDSDKTAPGKKRQREAKTDLQCPHCNKTFMAADGLDYHVRNFVCRPTERPNGPAPKGRPKAGDVQGKKKYKKVRGELADRTCQTCKRVFTSTFGLQYHRGRCALSLSLLNFQPVIKSSFVFNHWSFTCVHHSSNNT